MTLEGRQKVIDELHAMHPEGLDGLILSAAVSGACGSLTKIISLNYFGAVPVIKGTYDLLEKKHGSCVAVSSNVISQGIARMDIADLLNNCGDDGHHVPQCQSFLKRPADPDPVRAGNLFTKDGHYCDYCANGTPQHDYHLYGKEAISMFFRNKFLCRQYSILEPTVLSLSQAEFIACFGGYHVMAIGTLQQLSADGHIRRLTVRPK